MQSGLMLLMHDGAVRVSFGCPLTPDQYAEFLELAQRSKTRDELSDGGAEVAARWGFEIACEEVRV